VPAISILAGTAPLENHPENSYAGDGQWQKWGRKSRSECEAE